MKKFEEILMDIHNTTFEIGDINGEIEEVIDGYTLPIRSDKEKDQQLIDLNNKLRDIRVTLKFLKNNARISLYKSVMPVIVEVLMKYKGKPLGEKTKEKIYKECQDKTNCWVSISSREYMEEIYIGSKRTCDTTLSVTARVSYNKRLLVENKIQELTVDDFVLCGAGEYIEDVPGRMVELKECLHKAVDAYEAYIKLAKEYNRLGVGIIRPLDVGGIIDRLE